MGYVASMKKLVIGPVLCVALMALTVVVVGGGQGLVSGACETDPRYNYGFVTCRPFEPVKTHYTH
jgi:hypothetical protein